MPSYHLCHILLIRNVTQVLPTPSEGITRKPEQQETGIMRTPSSLSTLMGMKPFVCLRAQPCLAICDPHGWAHQATLSIRFPRQEYWSALPFPCPGDLPNPGIRPPSSVSPALAGGFLTIEPPEKPLNPYNSHKNTMRQAFLLSPFYVGECRW